MAAQMSNVAFNLIRFSVQYQFETTTEINFLMSHERMFTFFYFI